LSATGEPLLLFTDGTRITAPGYRTGPDRFWDREALVTEAGRMVLEGARDRVGISGIDRWLGGVHLSGSEARWRWDESAQKLMRVVI